MKKSASIAILTIVLACGVPFFGGAQAQSSDVKSVRGAAIEDTTPAPEAVKQNTSGRFTRAYRQQPPMIPHKIRGYQIDLKVNKCMSCHDWPNNVQQGAPKISETHYFDRQGVALDYVARTRWFCTQCHVSQLNAPELVPNSFKSALDVD